MRYLLVIALLFSLGSFQEESQPDPELTLLDELIEEDAEPEILMCGENICEGTFIEVEEGMNDSFVAGFGQSFVLILLSEIGDRTFIMVTIYAAKMKFLLLFLIANLSMWLMHTLSTLLGTVLTLIIPKIVTRIICVVLFFAMGAWSIYQGVKGCRKANRPKKEGESSSSDSERAEIEEAIAAREENLKKNKEQPINAVGVEKPAEDKEGPGEGGVQTEVNEADNEQHEASKVDEQRAKNQDTMAGERIDSERDLNKEKSENVDDAEKAEKKDDEKSGDKKEAKEKKKPRFAGCKNELLFVFALLVCSEWGDKSQIAAIALAPNYSIASVVIGGGLAHTVCIILAMLIGAGLQKCLKEHTINIIGGVFFLLFGIYELVFNIVATDVLCVEFLGGDCDEEGALEVSFSSLTAYERAMQGN